MTARGEEEEAAGAGQDGERDASRGHDPVSDSLFREVWLRFLGVKCCPGDCGGCDSRQAPAPTLCWGPGVSGSGRAAQGCTECRETPPTPQDAFQTPLGFVFPILGFFHYFPIKSFI